MAKIEQIQEVAVDELKPYEKNAKLHSDSQVEKIADSIREFGFLSPCLIDRDLNLIAGHGRVEAAKLLGMERVPCVFIDGLTEAQRRAYILADNRLTELGGWNEAIIREELKQLQDLEFDIDLTGFDFDLNLDWFKTRERNDDSDQEDNEEYNAFLDKFEIKKTTDDCYTPDVVYEAVIDWVANEYGADCRNFVRPFYPGGDYQTYNYSVDAIVVDNPPFSIISEIVRFYTEHGIKYFLFAPHLTLFSKAQEDCCTALACGAAVIYENGASVSTSFLTNLEPENIQCRTAPTLRKAVDAAVKEYTKEIRKELPKYDYCDYVVLSTRMAQFAKVGIEYIITKPESIRIAGLDVQKETDKSIYGGGIW